MNCQQPNALMGSLANGLNLRQIPWANQFHPMQVGLIGGSAQSGPRAHLTSLVSPDLCTAFVFFYSHPHPFLKKRAPLWSHSKSSKNGTFQLKETFYFQNIFSFQSGLQLVVVSNQKKKSLQKWDWKPCKIYKFSRSLFSRNSQDPSLWSSSPIIQVPFRSLVVSTYRSNYFCAFFFHF